MIEIVIGDGRLLSLRVYCMADADFAGGSVGSLILMF
jgi:hypothetical protein